MTDHPSPTSRPRLIGACALAALALASPVAHAGVQDEPTQRATRASTASSLVGERVEVTAKSALVYRRVGASYDGTLMRGQTIKVRRLSPSRTWARGLAYGNINRVVWIRTSALR